MKKGFTLIELLAVVLIVAILTAVAMPQYRKSLERSYLAEPRQLLPAIYDAADRLTSEALCSTWTECKTNGTLSFNKLDISMKGSLGDTVQKWETKHFLYEIVATGKTVTAQRKGGRWNGVKIIYDGKSFTCFAGLVADADKRQEACRILDFTKADE